MNFHYELAILVKACDTFLSVEKSTNCNLNLKKKKEKKRKKKKRDSSQCTYDIRYTELSISRISDSLRRVVAVLHLVARCGSLVANTTTASIAIAMQALPQELFYKTYNRAVKESTVKQQVE